MVVVVVERTDRLIRFGFRKLDTLLNTPGRVTEIVPQAENGTEVLLAALTAIVSSCYARLDGQCLARRKTASMGRELEAKGAGRGANATG